MSSFGEILGSLDENVQYQCIFTSDVDGRATNGDRMAMTPQHPDFCPSQPGSRARRPCRTRTVLRAHAIAHSPIENERDKMATASTVPVMTTPNRSVRPRERRHNEGRGRRLHAGVRGFGGVPGDDRVTQPGDAPVRGRARPSSADVVSAVEGDVALSIAVLRLADVTSTARHGAASRAP